MKVGLAPLYSIGLMVTGWEDAKRAFDAFPSFKTAFMWEYFAGSLILCYGFVVGCIIWSGSENGRSVAKRYLLISLCGFIGVEFIVMLLMGNLPAEVLAAGIGGAIGAIVGKAISFLVWWSYFKKSKRVRNTYGDEP